MARGEGSWALAVLPPPWGVWVWAETRDGTIQVKHGPHQGFEHCLSVAKDLMVETDGDLRDWDLQELAYALSDLRKGKHVTWSRQDAELAAYALGLAQAEVAAMQREHLIVLRHWHWGPPRVVIQQGERPLALVMQWDHARPANLHTTLTQQGLSDHSVREALLEAARLLALHTTAAVDLEGACRGSPPSTPFGLTTYGNAVVYATLAYGGQITLGQLLMLWPAARHPTVWMQLEDHILSGNLQVNARGTPDQWPSRTIICLTPEFLDDRHQPALPRDRAYYTYTQVRQRGWTDEQIGALLGDPDHTHTVRRGKASRYYLQSRVHATEQDPRFQRPVRKKRNSSSTPGTVDSGQ